MLAPSLLDVVQRMPLIIKFVGGKFRDLEVNHENNENWHPTKITRYTVFQSVENGRCHRRRNRGVSLESGRFSVDQSVACMREIEVVCNVNSCNHSVRIVVVVVGCGVGWMCERTLCCRENMAGVACR